MVRSVELIIRDPPPSTNHATTVIDGRKRQSKEYRWWLQAAGFELAPQRSLGVGPFYWRIDALVPRQKTKADLDNNVKAVIDAIVKAEKAPDDRYIVDERFRFWGGSFVKIIIRKEELSLWETIMKPSKSLTRRLAKFSP